MARVNGIKLNGTITVFRSNETPDKYGVPTYTKSEMAAAIYENSQTKQDTAVFKIEELTTVHTKLLLIETDRIYLASTTATDPDTLETYDVIKLKILKDVFQNVKGYKAWL